MTPWSKQRGTMTSFWIPDTAATSTYSHSTPNAPTSLGKSYALALTGEDNGHLRCCRQRLASQNINTRQYRFHARDIQAQAG